MRNGFFAAEPQLDAARPAGSEDMVQRCMFELDLGGAETTAVGTLDHDVRNACRIEQVGL
jgi:hypothetical protein